MNLNKMYFNTNLSKRKEMLLSIAKKSKSWKIRMILMAIFIAISVFIVIGTVLLLIKHPTHNMGIFAFSCGGVIFSSIPLAFASFLHYSARYKCALPYSSIANGTLILYEDRLEYVYWEVDKDHQAAYSKKYNFRDENKFVYCILKENIRKIEYTSDGVCKIFGDADIKLPFYLEDDFFSPEDKYEKCSDFSFLMCLDSTELNKIIDEWWTV